LRSEAYRRFLCFGLPIRSTKAFCGGGIPFGGFRIISRCFKMPRQLKSHHRISSFLIEIRELPGGILAGAGAPYARGDLLPISHICNAL
jgi:hypothetical protein